MRHPPALGSVGDACRGSGRCVCEGVSCVCVVGRYWSVPPGVARRFAVNQTVADLVCCTRFLNAADPFLSHKIERTLTYRKGAPLQTARPVVPGVLRMPGGVASVPVAPKAMLRPRKAAGWQTSPVRSPPLDGQRLNNLNS